MSKPRAGAGPYGDTTLSLSTRSLLLQPGLTWSLLVVERGSSCMVPLPSGGEVVVGRGNEADLLVDDRSVSRRHARIRVEAGSVSVADLDSRNGVRVNGAPCIGERALEAGDVVAIGDVTLILRGVREAPTLRDAERSGADPAGLVTLTLGEREIVLADGAMVRLFSLIERLAASDVPVLVVGETGTGKEHAAYAVHHGSARRAAPFVAVNCAAIPDSLFESEFFGHEKGAFSGAHTARIGLFERAAGGTLFLDELGELSAGAQAKLLRVLEGGRFSRVGDTRERKADVRVVAATNRDLGVEAREKRFRHDLYYRLTSAVVLIPPLRERPADVPVLARRFLAAARLRAGKAPLTIAPAAMLALARHTWPGNVRELKNAMEFVAAAVTDGVVEQESLPATLAVAAVASAPETRAPTTPMRPLAEEVSELERRRIEEALVVAGGVKSRAAQLISMPERTFRHKLRQYGIGRESED